MVITMDFKIGDLVTRNSYNNDIVFKITDIEDNNGYYCADIGSPQSSSSRTVTMTKNGNIFFKANGQCSSSSSSIYCTIY